MWLDQGWGTHMLCMSCPYFTDYMDCNVTIRRVHLEPPEGTSVNN